MNELLSKILNIKTYYSRLSDREQLIFILSCAGGILFVLTTIYLGLIASNVSMANTIKTNRKNIQAMAELGQKYRTLDETIQEMEKMIERTSANFQPGSELEMLAGQNQIKIDSIKNLPSTPHEFYNEIKVSVTIGEVQILPLMNFLLAIENSQKPMKISTLQIKPNFRDPKLLKVDFVVSTFQKTS